MFFDFFEFYSIFLDNLLNFKTLPLNPDQII